MSKDKLANLTPAQRDVLLKRLAERARAQKAAEQGVRSNGPIPLSFAQERQFFLDQVSPKDPSHIIIGALALDGVLDGIAFESALNAIFQKHEPLRAKFSLGDQGLEQSIRQETSVPIEQAHVQSAAEFQQIYKEQCGRGFDLAQDRLLRVVLVTQSPMQNWVIFSMHHIASDGWSIGLFLNEFLANYQAAVAGTLKVEQPQFTYGDFAQHQRERMETGRLDAGLTYWRKALENPPAVVEIATDTQDAVGRQYTGDVLELAIEGALKRQIARAATRAGTSVFTTLMAGFLVLVHRLAAEDDIIVGTPASGRSSVETEALIGLFLNTIPLRMRFSGTQSFADILEETKQRVLSGLDFQDVPFEKIVKDVAPQRSARDHPLFEIFFNYTPSPPRSLDMPGVSAHYVEPPTLRSDFSMSLYVTDWEDRFELRLVYQKNKYSKRRLEVLLEQYVSLLGQAVKDTAQPLCNLSLRLGTDQIEAASRAVPAQISVPQSIENRAAKTPDGVAVEEGSAQLSYHQLCTAMIGYARGLHAQGVCKGDVIAISGSCSALYISAMAAVLRAGGVLVTLADDLPAERIEAMLAASGAKFIWHTDGKGFTSRCISIAPECLVGDALLPAPDSPRAPAYVFFTSGSTGTPKAVCGTAGGLAHFVNWQRTEFDVGPTDRCAQLTAMSFDVVLRDVFLPLVSGATLVLPPADRHVTSGRTLEWLGEAKITSFHTVPSIVDAWLSIEQCQDTLPDLRRVFFAGEPLTDTLVRKWRGAAGNAAQIVNLYGPTETTLAKLFHVVGNEPFAGVQPLGEPIPNTDVIVLTKDKKACGVGELGEIAIRTPFQSLGYLNDEGATARQFIPNPLSDDPDDLLYLTGDLGQHDANGLLRYNGRADDQVKIRGVRIEPAEVNAALARHDGVSTSYVSVQKQGPNGSHLVAYVVLKKAHPLTTAELRAHLQALLPAPMIPSAFCFLDALPLNANHKVDRQNLPSVEDVSGQSAVDHQPPRTDTETKLAKIWSGVLGVSNPSVTANFFDLGGHSLLALRLLARMSSEAATSVALGDFLKNPTIEAMAAFAGKDAAEAVTVVLSSTPNLPTLFMVHTGGGTVLNYVPLAKRLEAVLNITAFQAEGIAVGSHPLTSIPQIAGDYVARLRSVQPHGPYVLGGHSFGGIIAYEMAWQLREAGCVVDHLMLFDTVLDRVDVSPDGADAQSQNARDLCGAIDIYQRFTGQKISVSHATLSALSVPEQFAHVEGMLDPSAESNDGMIERFVSIAKAHRTAKADYILRKTSQTTTLFCASETPATEPMRLDAADETLGWGKVIIHGLSVVQAQGDHVTMMADAHIDNLARQVIETLGAT